MGLWIPRSRSRWEHVTPVCPSCTDYFFLTFISLWISGRSREKSWVCLWLTLLGTMETLMWNCGQTFVPLLNWLLYFIFKHKLKLPGTFVSHPNHRKENPRVNRHFWEQPIQKSGKSMEYFGSDFEVIFCLNEVRFHKLEKLFVILFNVILLAPSLSFLLPSSKHALAQLYSWLSPFFLTVKLLLPFLKLHQGLLTTVL